MWNSDVNVDKYLYVRTNSHVIRFLGGFGFLATLLMAVGYFRFFTLSIYYLLIFAPIGFVFIFNKALRNFIQIFYPKFDIKKHEDFIFNFWATHSEPSVAIFLPWAGEDLDMHEEVLKGVSKIDYKNLKVYMLDDKGLPEHKALANKYGFVHLSRPNKGEHKKSGNLEYGYDHSTGEFVFILDADFIPSKSSLKDLIPYIASDSRIGILQTPQYLEQHDEVHKRSKIEFGGGNIVEDFYKINLPSRDVFKAAMCVGTSAIYRRTAIQKLNGTPKVHASEDLATGLLITEHGYYVKYLPLIASIGKSPETYQGYFKQHHRWCSGNLIFAKYWPRAHMNPVARLIYLSNPTYYFSEAFCVIFSFHFLALLYFHTESLSLAHALYFLPYVIFSRLLVPLAKSHKNKVGTRLAALNNSYTYIYTYVHLILSGVPTWHPTGIKTSKLHKDFVTAINIGITISSTFILLFIFVIFSRPEVLGNYNTYIILGWSSYSVVWHAVYLYLVSKDILKLKLPELENRGAKAFHYAKAHAVAALAICLVVSLSVNTAVALEDPSSPTVLALADVTGNTQTSPKIAISEPVMPAVEVPTVQAAETNNLFSYQVTSGDSPIALAEKAVTDFSAIYNAPLTENQLAYASAKLIKNSDIPQTIYPGDEVSFDIILISKYVVESLGK